MTMIQDFKKNISNLSGQSNILCYGSENIGSVSTLPGWRACGLSVFFLVALFPIWSVLESVIKRLLVS